MASPCLVLVDTEDRAHGEEVGALVRAEVERIEAKFSRYQPSVITTINKSAGNSIQVDDETADLLDFANRCYHLSERKFDITSGALRRAWRFVDNELLPSQAEVSAALDCVGWQRVVWQRPLLRLEPHMELDFGGIGKEYAVDRALKAATERTSTPVLVNLGGDLRVSGPRIDGRTWWVGIENIHQTGSAAGLLELTRGALATSGDAYRRIISAGVRYGHVLDPQTGWPVAHAPRSVTVYADTCSEAGMLAKLALLQGARAETFLDHAGARAWCVR